MYEPRGSKSEAHCYDGALSACWGQTTCSCVSVLRAAAVFVKEGGETKCNLEGGHRLCCSFVSLLIISSMSFTQKRSVLNALFQRGFFVVVVV